MRFYTAHIRTGAPPVLVREGFSWGALFFGPLWLAAHRAWVAAALSLAAFVLIIVLTDDGLAAALLIALVAVLGLSGHDLRRWSLDHRGYLLSQVVAAWDELDATARLLERRPDLKGRYLPPQDAR
ncbi:MAG TPA: DUF2628 domain-containing protein [Acetobacteraceae bacterium]|nr:DUF2628 domain-containing protein [Acetobacteraceae bacterium]